MSLKCHLEYNPSHLKFTKEDTLFSHYMLSYKSSLLGDIGSTHKHCSTGNWGLKCLIQTYIIHPQSWRVCIMRHATNLVRLLPQYTLMDTFFTLQGAWFPASFLLIKISMDNCRVSVHDYILTEDRTWSSLTYVAQLLSGWTFWAIKDIKVLLSFFHKVDCIPSQDLLITLHPSEAGAISVLQWNNHVLRGWCIDICKYSWL